MPLKRQETSTSPSAPKRMRSILLRAFVTTSSDSSMISACMPKQKAAAVGRDFIIPGTGISSDMYSSTASATALMRSLYFIERRKEP